MNKVEILPDVLVYNKHTYLKLKYKGSAFSELNEPYFSTETIRINSPNIVKKLVFPINNVEEPHLFKFVRNIEKSVDGALRNMKNADLEKQIPKVMNLLKEKVQNPSSTILRPNYSEMNSVYTCFFKGNANNTSLYTWDGVPIESPDELGVGDYQFIVRCNLVYFGPHLSCNAVANVQARVVAVRYRPTENSAASSVCPFTWNFSSNKTAILKRPAAATALNTNTISKRQKKPTVMSTAFSTDSTATKATLHDADITSTQQTQDVAFMDDDDN